MSDFHTNLENTESEFNQLKPKLNLDQKQTKLKDLETKTTDPNFWQDEFNAKAVTKQLSSIRDDLEVAQKIEDSIIALKELATSFQQLDPGSKKELARELRHTKKLLKQTKISILFDGPYDNSNAYLTIFSGQGGTEAMDWAQMLLRMYLKFFDSNDWNYELIDESRGEEAGIKSATILVNAKFAYGYLKSESGTHRLVRLSPFNADNLRQTSFAGVEVLPEIESSAKQVDIDPKDLEWQFFRSGGKGGQNVNKVSTAVRLKHLPSGIVVTSQTQRHQEQNRKFALSLLEAKLWLQKQEQEAKKTNKLKGEFKQAAWGNQIRSYVLHPYQMVKDHRTNHETSQAQSVLDGNLQPFLEAFLVH